MAVSSGMDVSGRCRFFFVFFKQKTAYEMLRSLVGSEMCIRDRAAGDDPPRVRLYDLRPPGERFQLIPPAMTNMSDMIMHQWYLTPVVRFSGNAKRGRRAAPASTNLPVRSFYASN